MIYLDELPSKGTKGGIDTVMENCAWDYGYGYRQLKIKIGRGKNWYPAKEGMEMDIKIVKMIYEEYKDKGVDILVDSNNTYPGRYHHLPKKYRGYSTVLGCRIFLGRNGDWAQTQKVDG